MALKVSINLPNSTVITLETTEAQVFREVVGLVLKDLPKDLLQMQPQSPLASAPGENSKNVGESNLDAHEAFKEFCRSVAPLADMHRVLVAAEGASRFLSIGTVSAKELEQLFDIAGWPRPKDFIQTLRNAGRRKFGWLQRVSGRQGYYTLTEKGREVISNLTTVQA